MLLSLRVCEVTVCVVALSPADSLGFISSSFNLFVLPPCSEGERTLVWMLLERYTDETVAGSSLRQRQSR